MDIIASYVVQEAGVHLTTDRQRALIVFTVFQGQVGISMSRGDLEELEFQINRELKRRMPPGD